MRKGHSDLFRLECRDGSRLLNIVRVLEMAFTWHLNGAICFERWLALARSLLHVIRRAGDSIRDQYTRARRQLQKRNNAIVIRCTSQHIALTRNGMQKCNIIRLLMIYAAVAAATNNDAGLQISKKRM
jgi:hypothetical protein